MEIDVTRIHSEDRKDLLEVLCVVPWEFPVAHPGHFRERSEDVRRHHECQNEHQRLPYAQHAYVYAKQPYAFEGAPLLNVRVSGSHVVIRLACGD